MSPKNSKPLPSPDPYRKTDIKRAIACFKLDVEKGSVGFLRRRITFTDADSFQNVWEGSQGKMEHIKRSFPMPERVVPEAENSQGSNDSDIKKAGQSSKKSTSKSSKNSKGPKKTNNLKAQVSQTSQPSSSSSPSINTNNDSTVVGSEEEDCVIIEQEKIVIDIEDNDNVTDSQVSSCSSSPDHGPSAKKEFTHWQRLFKLHGEITEAQQRLRKIEFMFQYDQSPVKACAEINQLRGHITVLINQLRLAKDDIDSGNFSDTMSPNTKKKYSEDDNRNFKRGNSSYTSIWGLFKSFCNEFVSVREKWKDVLMEHKGFQNSSPQDLQNSIQSIKFNITA